MAIGGVIALLFRTERPGQVEQFAGGSNRRHLFLLATCQQAIIEGFDGRVVAFGVLSRQVQQFAHLGIACLPGGTVAVEGGAGLADVRGQADEAGQFFGGLEGSEVDGEGGQPHSSQQADTLDGAQAGDTGCPGGILGEGGLDFSLNRFYLQQGDGLQFAQAVITRGQAVRALLEGMEAVEGARAESGHVLALVEQLQEGGVNGRRRRPQLGRFALWRDAEEGQDGGINRIRLGLLAERSGEEADVGGIDDPYGEVVGVQPGGQTHPVVAGRFDHDQAVPGVGIEGQQGLLKLAQPRFGLGDGEGALPGGGSGQPGDTGLVFGDIDPRHDSIGGERRPGRGLGHGCFPSPFYLPARPRTRLSYNTWSTPQGIVQDVQCATVSSQPTTRGQATRSTTTSV
jgi:hypothetical protein